MGRRDCSLFDNLLGDAMTKICDPKDLEYPNVLTVHTCMAEIDRLEEHQPTVKVLTERIQRRDNKIVRLERTIKRLRKEIKDWGIDFND